MSPATVPAEVLAADANDPLAPFRERFRLAPDLIYLDGNSLGALPASAAENLQRTCEVEWGRDLITSWNRHDWIGAPQRVGAKVAPLVGARPNEVIVCDSTSVNLFKLIVAALRDQRGRRTIFSEPGNFPTDLYIAQGVAELFPEARLRLLPADEIASAVDEDTALVLLTHVHYKTGRRLDMAAITRAAHAAGALALWDLSHSAGAVPLDLGGCEADLAVGCGYKYLNGGPGAPAFLYVAERLQERLSSPLTGWMGHAAPFEFDDAYRAARGLDRFLCGTPPVLAMSALEAGIDLFLEADLTAVWRKGAALGDLFIRSVEERCASYGIELVTPRRFDERGSHVSLAHPNAYEICQALIDRGVVGDFRAPDILRFGFTPLYTRYGDVWRAVEMLAEVMEERLWDRPQYRARARVT